MKLYRFFKCRHGLARRAMLLASLVASSSLIAAESPQRPEKGGDREAAQNQSDRGGRDQQRRGPGDRGPGDRAPRAGGPFGRGPGGADAQDIRSQGFKPQSGRPSGGAPEGGFRQGGFRPGGPMAGGASRGAEMMSRMIPVMAVLDADKDGALSAEEIAGAVAALKKLDRNGDGKLTSEELRPRMGQRGEFSEQRPESRGPADRGPNAGRPGIDRPGIDRPGMDRPGTDRAEFMGRMFSERDADKDGQLRGDEIPQQMASRLDRIDKNGDGAVSREELKEMMSRMRGAGGQRPQRPEGSGARPDSRAPRPGGEVLRRPGEEI